MSRSFKFLNPDGMYFVSFAVVEWLHALQHDRYKRIFLDCLPYYQEHKGLEVFAWCIMPNHVHLVFRVSGSGLPQRILGNIKSLSARRIIEEIKRFPQDPKELYYLEVFKRAGRKTSNTTDHQFWRHDNKPIELYSRRIINIKLRYVHQNPVKAGMVRRATDYPFSSARDYCGLEGLLPGIVKA